MSEDGMSIFSPPPPPREPPTPRRRKLPDERRALTHKFSVVGHEGYITVGLYEDGTPGEIFLTMAKEGSTISGLMDAFATAISLSLQYGVPLEALVEKFSHMRFEPAGFTKNAEIPIAKSLVDYIFRYLALKFLGKSEAKMSQLLPASSPEPIRVEDNSGAPNCHECGSLMVRAGSCFKCLNCGATSGCS